MSEVTSGVVERGGFDCYRCWKDWAETVPRMTSFGKRRMFLCPTCGNKRCPRATDHRLACTDSNEPGQEGSLYANTRALSLPSPTEEAPAADLTAMTQAEAEWRRLV